MAEARAQRRLSAILAGDIAGYSRLMGANEEGTLATLRAHRGEFIDPTIAQHRGRIVKTTGDGILLISECRGRGPMRARGPTRDGKT